MKVAGRRMTDREVVFAAMQFGRALHYVTHFGSLKVTDASGRVYENVGAAAGSAVTVRLLDASLNHKILFNPWLRLGEAYMDGTLVIEDGTNAELIEFLCINGARVEGNSLAVTVLSSDMGKLYVALAQAIDRLRS